MDKTSALAGLVLAALVAGAAPSRADSSAPLTLPDCVRLAMRKAPEARQAGLERESARAALDSARGALLPQLTGQASYLNSTDPNNQLPNTSQINFAVLQLDQNLNPFSPQWARHGEKARELDAASFRLEQARASAALAARQAYFAVLDDQDALTAMGRVKQRLETLLEMVPPRYVPGLSLPLDSIQVKSALLDLSDQTRQARASLRADQDRLQLLLGATPGEAPSLSPLTTLPALPDPQGGSLELNPGLRALQSDVQAGQARLDGTEAQRLPSLSLEADVGPAGLTADSMDPGWGAGVTASLPIFAWGCISAQVRQSRTDLEILRQQAGSFKNLLQAQWSETLQKAGQDRRAEVERQAFLPLAAQAVEAAVERYRRGAAGITLVNDTIQSWLRNQVSERQDYYSYLSDLAQLQALSGDKLEVNYE